MPRTVQLPVCGARTTPVYKLQHHEDHACPPQHWCLHGTDTQRVLNNKYLSNSLKKEGTHKQMSKQHSTIQLKTLCLCKSGVYYTHLLSPVEPYSSLSFTSSPVSPHQLTMSWDHFLLFSIKLLFPYHTFFFLAPLLSVHPRFILYLPNKTPTLTQSYNLLSPISVNFCGKSYTNGLMHYYIIKISNLCCYHSTAH